MNTSYRRVTGDDANGAAGAVVGRRQARGLARVTRRYPRIALEILMNIARILSDHVQRQTDETRALAATLEGRARSSG